VKEKHRENPEVSILNKTEDQRQGKREKMQTMASRRFLGLWCCSQSLSLAKSSSFLDSCFRLTSTATTSFLTCSMTTAFFSPSISTKNKQPLALAEGEARLWFGASESRDRGFIYSHAGSIVVFFYKHSINIDTHICTSIQPYKYTYVYPIPMNTSERLNRLDLEIHEVSH
jgi:hypothetical protein